MKNVRGFWSPELGRQQSLQAFTLVQRFFILCSHCCSRSSQHRTSCRLRCGCSTFSDAPVSAVFILDFCFGISISKRTAFAIPTGTSQPRDGIVRSTITYLTQKQSIEGEKDDLPSNSSPNEIALTSRDQLQLYYYPPAVDSHCLSLKAKPSYVQDPRDSFVYTMSVYFFHFIG